MLSFIKQIQAVNVEHPDTSNQHVKKVLPRYNVLLISIRTYSLAVMWVTGGCQNHNGWRRMKADTAPYWHSSAIIKKSLNQLFGA